MIKLTRLLGNLRIFQIYALIELYYHSIITQENLHGIPAEKTKCDGKILELKFDAVSFINKPVCIRTQLLIPNIIFMETRIKEPESGSLQEGKKTRKQSCCILAIITT